MKKIVSFMLVLCIVMSMFTIATSAETSVARYLGDMYPEYSNAVEIFNNTDTAGKTISVGGKSYNKGVTYKLLSSKSEIHYDLTNEKANKFYANVCLVSGSVTLTVFGDTNEIYKKSLSVSSVNTIDINTAGVRDLTIILEGNANSVICFAGAGFSTGGSNLPNDKVELGLLLSEEQKINSQNKYVLHNFDSVNGIESAFNATSSLATDFAYEGTASVKLQSSVPVGQLAKVGAMMFVNLESAVNLTNYKYFHLNFYTSVDMVGSHALQINFVTKSTNQDGYNVDYNINNLKAGWHTVTLSKDFISTRKAVADVDLTSISRLRLSWFNYSELDEKVAFYFDDMYVSNSPVIDSFKGLEGKKMTIGNTDYNSGIQIYPGADNTATATYNVKNMNASHFVAKVGKNVNDFSNYRATLTVYADSKIIAQANNITKDNYFSINASIPSGTSKVILKAQWQAGDESFAPINVADAGFAYTASANNSGVVYLSNIKEDLHRQLDNTFMRDTNYAGTGAISIEGKTFEKGISIHPASTEAAQIVYDITGLNVKTFSTYLGQCDTANSDGDGVTCYIFVDGVEKYKKEFQHNTSAALATVSVEGASMVKIVVDYNGNSASDAFSLGDAKFTLNCATPGLYNYRSVDMTEYYYTSYSSNNGDIKLNNSLEDTKPIQIGYRPAKKGFVIHPTSAVDAAYIEYDIRNLSAEYFTAKIGKTVETTISNPSKSFLIKGKIYLDDVLVKETQLMSLYDYAIVKVNIKGAKKLKIAIDPNGDYTCDSTAIGEPTAYVNSSKGNIIIDSPIISNPSKISGNNSITFIGKAPSVEKLKVIINGTDSGEIATLDKKGNFVYEADSFTTNSNVIEFVPIINGQNKTIKSYYFYLAAYNTLSLMSLGYHSKGTNGTLYVGKGPYRDKQLMIGGAAIRSNDGFCAFPNAGDANSKGRFEVNFDISQLQEFTYFEVTVGRDDFAPVVRGGTRGSAMCYILADGVEIAKTSKIIRGGGYELLSCNIPANTQMLTLVTSNYDGTNHSDYIDWISPTLVRSKEYIYRTEQTLFNSSNAQPNIAKYSLAARFKTTVSGKAVSFRASRFDTSKGIVAKLYRFTYNRNRSMQETPMVEATVYPDSNGRYTLTALETIPAGEYLLELVNAQHIRYTPSSFGAVYTDGAWYKGFAEISVKFTEIKNNYFATISAEGTEYDIPYTTDAEKSRAEGIYRGYINNLASFPASVTIGGVRYNGFGNGFTEISRKVTNPDAKREQTVIKLKHTSNIEFELTTVFYPDYAAFDWVVYFTNKASSNSPTVTEFDIANINFSGKNGFFFNSYGESEPVSPYYPFYNHLENGDEFMYDADSGRSSEQDSFPYYNFEYGNQGALMAVGWPGGWRTDITYNNNVINVQSCQSLLNAYLEPGETLRTPLMAFVLYDGRDLDRATNLWRNWFIDCNMYNENGNYVEPGIGACPSVYRWEMLSGTDSNMLSALQKFIDYGISLDYWWMDAGWYSVPDYAWNDLSPWLYTGNWQVDTKRFPSQLEAVADFAKQNGIKTILWFEPERVGIYVSDLEEMSKTSDTVVKPEWLCGIDTDYNTVKKSSPYNLLNIGNEECLEWLIDTVSKILMKADVSIYREDFNVQPMSLWLKNDKSGRKGVTENKCAEGHLKYWDALLQLDCVEIIDSCASGGHRLDLESMRRAMALHPADHDYEDFVVKQTMMYGIGQWFPYFGGNSGVSDIVNADIYKLRSAYRAYTQLQYNPEDPNFGRDDANIIKQAFNEFELIKGYYYKDLYQITDWTVDPNKWYAYEYHDPNTDKGYSIAYRRDGELSPTSESLKFKGLKQDVIYKFSFHDSKYEICMNGKQAMESGVPITLANKNTSEIIFFEPVTSMIWLDELTPIEGTCVKNQDHLGKPITFSDGKSYSRGVALSAGPNDSVGGYGASVSFDISSYSYNRFSATVGSMTDYIFEGTLISYMVYADGKLITVTPSFTHSSGGHFIDVEIPVNASRLDLKIRTMPTDNSGTVCFANAKLYSGNPDPKDSRVYLSDLTPVTTYGDQGVIHDVDRKGHVLAFSDGVTCQKGVSLAVWSNEELGGYFAYSTYDISGINADNLNFTVGSTMDYFDPNVNTRFVFSVLADGNVIYTSNEMGHADGSVTVDVTIPPNTKIIELRGQTTPNNVCGTFAFGNCVLSSKSLQNTIDAIENTSNVGANELATAISSAKALYNSLTEEQMNQIHNVDKLISAEKRLIELIRGGGDISGNGIVEASDALLALQSSIMIYPLDEREKSVADVNRDTIVSSTDALAILQYSVELIDKLPIK